VLLGTTFPLMSAGVIRRGGETGRTLSLLYFTNSIGAASGVLLAGFWLLAAAGLPGTLVFAGIVNIVVALLVGLVGRGESEGAKEARAARELERLDRYPEPLQALGTDRDETVLEPSAGANVPVGGAPPTPDAAAGAARRPSIDPLERLLLSVAFGTAVASFIYEIAWIRMLSLVLGSATHSFEIMLSAFILGIALGAFWVRRHADRFRRPLLALGIVQWAMGALAVLTLPVYLSTFHITAGLLRALDVTAAGYSAFTVARYGIALLVMLPATFCAGMTLPLITRTLMSAGGGERAIGTVYGVNTFGSIVGAALAGLVLLPMLGLKALLVIGAIVDMGLGVWLVARAGVVSSVPDEPVSVRHGHRTDETSAATRRLALGVGGATVLLLILVVSLTRLAPELLASGVYRYGRANLRPGVDSVLSYRDGRTASVAVRQSRSSGDVTIATNGKPDASVGIDWLRPVAPGKHRTLSGDQPTQMLLPLVTLAHAPRASEMAVIGQGSGMSSHFLLGSPHLKRLVTIDIEPEMIRGSRFFYPANRRVFDDPRSAFAIDDAKSYFAAQRRTYDLILSEPSNPWVSGVSGLFTTEFYARVRGYLSPGGVFGQWLHLYEIDDGLVLSVIAVVHENFPAYEIYLVANSDMLIVAGNSRQLPPADWSVFAYPGVREDVRHLEPAITPVDLAALRIASRGSLSPLLDASFGGATANSDFYPTLDLGAERARYLGAAASGLAGLGSSRFDIIAALTDRRREFGTAFASSIPGIPRLDACLRWRRRRMEDVQ
jgi:MFS family permease